MKCLDKPHFIIHFQDDHYLGPSVDIWALGILLYFLVTGMMPFKGQTVAQLKHSIIDGYFSCPDQLSTDCSSLIHGILRKKPETRLDMQEVKLSELNHHMKHYKFRFMF